jgi:metallo-beta-lactamase family protein
VQYTESWDLLTETQLEVGYLPERKAKAFEGAAKVSPAYERLVAVGQLVAEAIKRAKDRDNKSLAWFAEQLKKLLEKWEA